MHIILTFSTDFKLFAYGTYRLCFIPYSREVIPMTELNKYENNVSADAQADLRLRWAHRSFCWVCHAFYY